MEERHHPKAHRPSPRWKEPLVEEFPASNEQRRQNGSQTDGKGGTIPPSSRGVNGTSPTPSTTANGTGSGGFGNWTERERRRGGREDDFLDHGFGTAEPPPLALGEEEAEEPFFFSEEFYQAFPHLRPSSSTGGGGGGRRWFSSASGPSRRRTGSSLLTEDPEFSSHLDRFDRNWRNDPFWRDLYPRWAEPIFKDGIDVKTSIVNDSNRFAVDIDTYQFRPEELQVKTLDDTLVIEGRHEDVRDRDNYTKMYFVRKYQLPSDVEPQSISSHVDSRGHLTVEARKLYPAIEGRERSIPIESPSGRRLFGGSRSSSYSPRDRYYDSGRGSANDYYRAESRQQQDGGGGVGGGGGGTGGGYLSPNPPKSNGYRTEFEQRQTDANGMRHEARREEFREEVRRTGSAANVLPPPSPVPVYRTGSRLSAAANGGEESHFRRTASQSRNEFRQYSSNGGTEYLLRPADELGGRTSSSSLFGRSVPIQRA